MFFPDDPFLTGPDLEKNEGEGDGQREWMGDGCGSGTGLDPDSIS
jgi:hypothetical protein